jgi:hypothetical protein
MYDLRGRRLISAVFFSFGALSGILCLRRLKAEDCALLWQRISGWLARSPRGLIIGLFLVWPLILLLFGASVIGALLGYFVLVLCGFAVGAAAYLFLKASGASPVFLLAMLPFSCCIVSFAADMRLTKTYLRTGGPVGDTCRFARMRMAVSLLILLLEALCLMRLDLPL